MIKIFDTIAAVATAPGPGGIGIVRISGPLALTIIDTLFSAPKYIQSAFAKKSDHKARMLTPWRIHYGYIVDPDTQLIVDEVIVLFMKAPHSYTCEDVIEIQSHAGTAVLQKILGLILKNGARLAEPGEFTRRAFLQGRIDLTQAEAVVDLINAQSDEAIHMATRQLTGGMAQRAEKIRQQLQLAAGQLEATIEFPEEVLNEEEVHGAFAAAADTAQEEIRALLQVFQESHIYRDGIMVSVVGRPNVGKSSLLNALLERERAIVTALPGTTRDLVIDSLQVKGIPIQISDTAGMHTSDDLIEKIGICKTEESIAAAQLILFVVDAQEDYKLEDENIYRQLKNKTVLMVINKIDLVGGKASPPVWRERATPYVTISAKYHQNIETLKEQMAALITQGTVGPPTNTVVPNFRQKNALEKASEEVGRALSAFKAGASEEFIVFHLQSALNDIGTITGETYTDDLLDIIFDRFCIGK